VQRLRHLIAVDGAAEIHSRPIMWGACASRNAACDRDLRRGSSDDSATT
jgi:hypothetical protein